MRLRACTAIVCDLGCCSRVRRSFNNHDCSGTASQVTATALPIGFELATNGIQSYVIADEPSYSSSGNRSELKVAMDPVNLFNWAEENKSCFQPPICNKLLYKVVMTFQSFTFHRLILLIFADF